MSENFSSLRMSDKEEHSESEFYYPDELEFQVPVVRKVDNAIQQINHYPVDIVVCFVNTYLLDSNLSSG